MKMGEREQVNAKNILVMSIIGNRDGAWRIINTLTSQELDDLEDAIDTVQDLIDARRAATTLLKLNGGGWE